MAGGLVANICPPPVHPQKILWGFWKKTTTNKQEQKSEDSEMKTVLWAEKAVLPGQPTSGQPLLQGAAWLCGSYEQLSPWCLQIQGFLGTQQHPGLWSRPSLPGSLWGNLFNRLQ